MKLLTNLINREESIKLAPIANEKYEKSVIFHCYWNGQLNEKHLYSILTCYYFNVYQNNHRIILWLENNNSNNINEEIKKYAQINYINIKEESRNTFLENYEKSFTSIPYRADYIRSLLIYKYGGCWFDLDCFILRSFDSLFKTFENEICVYTWERQNYPNNAIYFSLKPFDERMKQNMEFIINRNRGWGFQEAQLTYDLPMNLLVLPCSWFDPDWLSTSCDTDYFFESTEEKYTFESFFPGRASAIIGITDGTKIYTKNHQLNN